MRPVRVAMLALRECEIELRDAEYLGFWTFVLTSLVLVLLLPPKSVTAPALLLLLINSSLVPAVFPPPPERSAAVSRPNTFASEGFASSGRRANRSSSGDVAVGGGERGRLSWLLHYYSPV
eukprot:SAG11_NODE_24_length_24699_cov_10.132195_4_plen_121_part_00